MILRGGDEHRTLKLSQFQFKIVPNPKQPGTSVECVTYVEHGSKNQPGGSRQLNLDNKEVTHFANPSLGASCYVFILKKYFSKLPMKAFEMDSFYLKPRRSKQALKNEGEPWFECQPVGHNKLAGMLKDMLHSASIGDSNKSNHRLRVTGISRLYQNGLLRKLFVG